jgi:hypothetical protein
MKSSKTSISNGGNTFTVSGLKPNTVYYFKILASSANGSTTTKTVKSKTKKIPPKPRSSGGSSGGSGGSSGGGSYILNVQWQRLDVAKRLVPGASVYQASNCWQYGFENGGLGIWNESNWIVVSQSGRSLYVCKK